MTNAPRVWDVEGPHAVELSTPDHREHDPANW
jgi:hypothetical protein